MCVRPPFGSRRRHQAAESATPSRSAGHNREAESAMPSGTGPGGAGSRQASLERVKRAREHLAWIQLQRPRDYESMDRAVRRLQDEIADLEYKKRQAHDHEGVYVYDERNKKKAVNPKNLTTRRT